MKRIAVGILVILMYYGIEGTGLFLMKQWGAGETHEMFWGFVIPLMLILAVFVRTAQKKLCGPEDLYETEAEHMPGITWVPVLMPFALLSVYLEAFLTDRLDGKLFVVTVLAFLTGFCEEGMFRGIMIRWGKTVTASAVSVIAAAAVGSAVLPALHLVCGMSLQSVLARCAFSVLPGISAGIIFYFRENLWGLICWHMFLEFSFVVWEKHFFYAVAAWGMVLDALVMLELFQVLYQIWKGGKIR